MVMEARVFPMPDTVLNNMAEMESGSMELVTTNKVLTESLTNCISALKSERMN